MRFLEIMIVGLIAAACLTGPATGQPAPGANVVARPSCEAQATQRGLTGPARATFVAECGRQVPGAASPAERRRGAGRTAQECREIAARNRLWGLARYRFVKRCRAGRSFRYDRRGSAG